MAKQKEQIEYVNPKFALRRIVECLPTGLGHLREVVVALYAYSDGILLKEDLDAGTIRFTTSAAASQLAKFCDISVSAMRKRLDALQATGIVASSINPNRNRGNDFKVYYSTGIPFGGYTREDAIGVPVEGTGVPVEGGGYTRQAGTSVFTGSSGEELSGYVEQDNSLRSTHHEQHQEPQPDPWADLDSLFPDSPVPSKQPQASSHSAAPAPAKLYPPQPGKSGHHFHMGRCKNCDARYGLWEKKREWCPKDPNGPFAPPTANVDEVEVPKSKAFEIED